MYDESRKHGVEWGKLNDYFKELPITIKDWEMMTESDKDEIINKKIIRGL